MHELVTTLLEVLGLLLVSVGVAMGLWPLIDGWSLCAAGFVVIGGSLAASMLASRGERR